jgi:hypothetical protein
MAERTLKHKSNHSRVHIVTDSLLGLQEFTKVEAGVLEGRMSLALEAEGWSLLQVLSRAQGIKPHPLGDCGRLGTSNGGLRSGGGASFRGVPGAPTAVQSMRS